MNFLHLMLLKYVNEVLWSGDDIMDKSGYWVASHAGVFRGARISSLPTE